MSKVVNLYDLALLQLSSGDSYKSIELLLNHKDCSHLTRVKFALYCARSVAHLARSEDASAVANCLDLVDRYCKGEQISKAELESAANAAYAASYAASVAAHAAYATAYAAYAAAYATYATAYAPAAAANTGHAAKLKQLVILIARQFNKPVEMLEVLYA